MEKLFNAAERQLAEAIGRLNYTNPFTPERLALEKTILGPKYRPGGQVWNLHTGGSSGNRNVDAIDAIAAHLVQELHRRAGRRQLLPDELEVYEPLALYHLFEKYRQPMYEIMLGSPAETCYPCFTEFRRDYELLIGRGDLSSGRYEPARTFAMYFQIHRAFYFIFDFIVGGSLEAGKLRSSIWQSIFTTDLYRYHRVLYERMNAITTLITGESGTGKELVARAVALSQFIPFDAASRRFACSYLDCFLPVHLSAMPQTMIESELFGHRKGAFTGALADRIGYFEGCVPQGSVFLDEIGEISFETQVKLLRVLQSRKFNRLGENAEHSFSGKVIAATNRDLHKACEEGHFRVDLYYRLCADQIETVPLRRLIHGQPEELRRFVRIMAERLLGVEEARLFVPEAVDRITATLGEDYAWPGNVRELEQCVRNLVIRGSYTPAEPAGRDELFRQLERCTLTADELLRLYLKAVYAHERTCQQTARFAGLDRRTVKKYLDPV